MASSMRLGSAALRTSFTTPVRTSVSNGLRFYSSKTSVSSPFSPILSHNHGC